MIPTVAHPESYVTFFQGIRFTPAMVYPGGWVATEGYVLIHTIPGARFEALIDVTLRQPACDLLDYMRDQGMASDSERQYVMHRDYSEMEWLQRLGALPVSMAPARVQRAFDAAIPQEVHAALAEGSVYTCARDGAGKEITA